MPAGGELKKKFEDAQLKFESIPFTIRSGRERRFGNPSNMYFATR